MFKHDCFPRSDLIRLIKCQFHIYKSHENIQQALTRISCSTAMQDTAHDTAALASLNTIQENETIRRWFSTSKLGFQLNVWWWLRVPHIENSERYCPTRQSWSALSTVIPLSRQIQDNWITMHRYWFVAMLQHHLDYDQLASLCMLPVDPKVLSRKNDAKTQGRDHIQGLAILYF